MAVITEEKIEKFLEELKADFEVFSAQGGSASGGDSFKKYFFPAVEEIFTTHLETGFPSALGNPVSKSLKKPACRQAGFIVFGLNLPDLEALTQLDGIMKKPNEDYFYFQRRKAAIVIGLIKEEVDVAPGGDIVFQDIGDNKYKVWQNTAKGKNLIKKYAKFFNADKATDVETPQIPDNDSLSEWQKSMRELLLDPEILAKAVEWSRDHKIWDELKEKCLGCGICTYVCPLCYCFSIEDKVGLDGKCSRCRKWDACTLPEFAKIAGNHSFRPTIKERYYNWFYHKFVRAYKEYGKSQCVGCGRCKNLCPASIDIKEILTIILADYKKAN